MIKYLMLGIVLMGMAAFAGSQMQQTYAQTATPTNTITPTPSTSSGPSATPTTSMSTPKAPATGRAM